MVLFQYFEMVKGAIIVLIFPMEHSENLGILNFNDIFTIYRGLLYPPPRGRNWCLSRSEMLRIVVDLHETHVVCHDHGLDWDWLETGIYIYYCDYMVNIWLIYCYFLCSAFRVCNQLAAEGPWPHYPCR